jgi:hypothetical protein
VQTSAMPSPAQSEFYAGLLPVEPSVEPPPVRPTAIENDHFPNGKPSLSKRASRALARFLITFCIGVAATFGWQAYGDVAREMIVNSYPQLGWLAPQAEPVAQNAPDMIALAVRAATSVYQQKFDALSLDLDAVRQSIDRIATGIAISQEQMMHSVDQLATGIAASQEQVTQRRQAHGRPGADDARNHETTGDRTVHPLQELRAFAAACLRLRAQARVAACLRPAAQARAAAVAGTDGALMARSSRPGLPIMPSGVGSPAAMPLTLARNP